MSERPTNETEPGRDDSVAPAATDTETQGARRKRFKVVALVAGGFFSLVAIGMLAVGYSSYRAISQHPGFIGTATTKTTPIAIGLGGHRFEIPANYFYGPPEPAFDQRDILLLALWPTMDGRTSENYGHFRVGDFGRKILMLLKDYQRYPISAIEGVEITLNRMLEEEAPLKANGLVDGLEHLVPLPKRTQFLPYELLIQRAGGELESFIACRPDGSVPFPICIHWFPIGENILAQVTYGKPHFPKWRQIQRSVVALLDRFANETAAKSDERSPATSP